MFLTASKPSFRAKAANNGRSLLSPRYLDLCHEALISVRHDFPLSLMAALEATAARRIVGDTLQLRDGRGTVRVRFEALYLR